jgi:hypothetical protein
MDEVVAEIIQCGEPPSSLERLLSPSGGKKEQGPPATLAFLAFLAMWFV